MITDRLGLLHEVADAVAAAMRTVTDWGPSGQRDGQYALDVTADEAALAVIERAGVGVLSEESGYNPGTTGEVVVIDPIDGSTNASRGFPWFATSLCLVDANGPAAAVVVNQATGVRYTAERGGGAWCGERRLQPSGCATLSDAIVVISAVPPADVGWAQFRALGACALDLCALADGVVDGYVDFGDEQHGVWDYLGGWMICREAGIDVVDAFDREMVHMEHAARRTPVAAATPELAAQLLAARRPRL
ncbi:MAG TPA: inositol monophosphatase [Ilumatobacteraceae bacterium]|jgi:fructose-1,6-bisphosphatase/inositol monophosphatase family enzyme|nr:inositol monophosphatase [Ilumatobacteraceae bacterium]